MAKKGSLIDSLIFQSPGGRLKPIHIGVAKPQKKAQLDHFRSMIVGTHFPMFDPSSQACRLRFKVVPDAARPEAAWACRLATPKGISFWGGYLKKKRSRQRHPREGLFWDGPRYSPFSGNVDLQATSTFHGKGGSQNVFLVETMCRKTFCSGGGVRRLHTTPLLATSQKTTPTYPEHKGFWRIQNQSNKVKSTFAKTQLLRLLLQQQNTDSVCSKTLGLLPRLAGLTAGARRHFGTHTCHMAFEARCHKRSLLCFCTYYVLPLSFSQPCRTGAQAQNKRCAGGAGSYEEVCLQMAKPQLRWCLTCALNRPKRALKTNSTHRRETKLAGTSTYQVASSDPELLLKRRLTDAPARVKRIFWMELLNQPYREATPGSLPSNMFPK